VPSRAGDFVNVSDDLLLSAVDVPCLDDLLAELRAGQDACETLFNELLDQWDQVFSQAAACMTATLDRRLDPDPRLDQVLALLDQIRQGRTHESAEQPGIASRLEQFLAQQHSDLSLRIETILQQMSAVAQSSEQCRAAVVDLRTPPEDPDSTESLRQQMAALDAEKRQAEQERREVENELEGLRNRAAELVETLARQQANQAQQESEWGEELRRMRQLLEEVSQRLVEAALPCSPAQEKKDRPAPSGSPQAPAMETLHGDPVLDSVMAQFEMLQRDIAKRRANRR